MVRSVSAVAAVVVAMKVATGMAMPYDSSAYALEARDYYDELDFETRDYFDELEAREVFSQFSEIEAREYYDLDAREYAAVMEYIRDVTTTTATTATATLHTITVTHTHHPEPTSCTKSELKEQAKEHAAKKAAEHDAWKAARKAKKEAKKTRKAEEKKHKHDKHATTTATTTTAAVTATTTSATTTTLTATHTGTHVHAAAFAAITPPPALTAGPNVTITTHTGHHGTVTVEVTTTAPVPQCTKASRFKKLFRHHHDTRSYDEEADSVFARAYDFDDLD